MKPGPKASEKPTFRELKVLKAVADGCTLKTAGERLGIPATQVSHILTRLYIRFGIQHMCDWNSRKDRRDAAVRICKRRGWWQD